MIDIGQLSQLIASITHIAETAFDEASYVAKQTLTYTNELKAKQISADEYSDLMEDLKVDQIVARTSEEEEVKVALKGYMQQLISIASTIAMV